MKKRKIGLLVFIIISLFFLSACRDGNTNSEEVSSAPTAENTATSESTETPTAVPTDTPEPTDTPTPTHTPTPEPTDTPRPTDTATPTSTATPTTTSTSSPEPTNTSAPVQNTAVPPTSGPAATADPGGSGGGSDEFPLPLPSGPPAAQWNGIPIMPQAIAGDEGDGSYYYTIGASVLTIQNYYQSQMINLGWDLFAMTVGQNDAVLLIFQNRTTGETATIAIFTVDANTRYVLLVR